MRFHYDITGAEPIVRDVPVYDGSTTDGFNKGEMICQGATAGSADCTVAFITGYNSSQASSMVHGLGVIQEDVDDGTNAAGTSFAYGKAIINPFAIYLAEYDVASAIAFTTSTVTWTFTGTSEDNIDFGWAFVVTATTSGNIYNLRQITAAASGSFTIAALDGGNETAGTGIKILPVNHKLVNLTADATKILMLAAAAAGVSLRIVENYVNSNGRPMQALRAAIHRGAKLDAGAKFYADLCMLDHVYNTID